MAGELFSTVDAMRAGKIDKSSFKNITRKDRGFIPIIPTIKGGRGRSDSSWWTVNQIVAIATAKELSRIGLSNCARLIEEHLELTGPAPLECKSKGGVGITIEFSDIYNRVIERLRGNHGG